MTILLGFISAILGSFTIGLGQTLQKHALNKLSSSSDRPIFGHKLELRPRYKDRLWLFGIMLALFGEVCGNWLALSFLSTAIVTPIGIVAVLTNRVLAAKYLGEKMTKSQEKGFILLLLGALIILIGAPKGKTDIGDNPKMILEYIESSYFCIVFLAAFILQSMCAYYTLRIKKSISTFAITAAMFNSMMIMCSKTFSLFSRIYFTHPDPNPLIIAKETIHEITGEPIVLHVGASIIPLIIVFLIFVLSATAQELFKQWALGIYSLSEFQPTYFASYNTICVLMGIILFRELNPRDIPIFIILYIIGVVCIILGSRLVQSSAKNQKYEMYVKNR